MRTISKDKEEYKEFCEIHKTPIFIEGWWLDAVSEGDWEVIMSKKGENIEASWAYYKRRKMGASYVTMPIFSPYQGPFIVYPPNQKTSRRIAFEKEVMTFLLESLPKFSYFNQRFGPRITNWLPLYWEGFEQQTRYTYILSDLSNEEKLWSGLQSRLRRAIRKASNRYDLIVRSSIETEIFHKLHEMTYQRQGKKVPCSFKFFDRLFLEAKKRNRGEILLAYDSADQIHAGVFIVWDSERAYYLMGGADPSLRNSGASSLLLWEAIKRQSGLRKSFDFEGSMMEPVEKIFRAFGADQTPYFRIRKWSKFFYPLKFFLE